MIDASGPTPSILTAAAPVATRVWAPPVLLSVLASLPGLLLTIEAASRNSFISIVLLFLLCLAIAITWLIFLLVALATARLRLPVRHWVRWLLIPLMLALTFVTAGSDIPFRVRFSLSQGAMDQVAADVMAGGPTTRTSIGLFPVTGVERLSNGMRFLIDGAGFLGGEGLAYSSDGPPEDVDGIARYEWLDGHWWRWSEEFD